MKAIVTFEENGSEYSCTLTIKCKTLEQTGNRCLLVNGALIEIDEDILSIVYTEE